MDPVGCNEYFDNAAQFDPAAFDPAAWADLAWRAGARYVVFTAKHHDGFAMFDTGLSDYSITKHTPFGRDATAEIVEAFRARGFRIGLYFSIIDWHHPDYPRYTDETVTKPYIVGSYPRVTPGQMGTLPHLHARPARRNCSPATATSTSSGSTANSSTPPTSGASMRSVP